MAKYKEYKVGEIFKYNGNRLITIKNDTNKCEGCFFDTWADCLSPDFIVCDKFLRKDETDVFFKKISEIEELILKGDKND